MEKNIVINLKVHLLYPSRNRFEKKEYSVKDFFSHILASFFTKLEKANPEYILNMPFVVVKSLLLKSTNFHRYQ